MGRLIKQVVLLAALASTLLAVTGSGATSERCGSVDECIATIRQLGVQSSFASQQSKAQVRIIPHILAIDGAVPRLVELLAHPDDDVANIAAAALADAPEIDSVFLPQVIAGLDRDLGWLPPALARMDSDAAASEAVARYIGSDSAPHNQEAYALRLLGVRAIAPIVEAARCNASCAPGAHRDLAGVLEEMGPERGLAAPGLIAIVEAPATPPGVADGALEMIAALGESGRPVEDRLEAVRASRPELATAAELALVGVRASSTGSIYARWLSDDPSEYLLRDLAEAGTLGRDAGHVVAALLDSEDPDLRVAAARTLGYIRFPAVQELVTLLDETDDVRLEWVAAESLGRIGDPRALPGLAQTVERHWFAPVREVATTAVHHIESGVPYPPGRRGNFAFEYFDYLHFRLDPCAEAPESPHRVAGQAKLHADDGDDLTAFAYRDEVIGYGASDAEAQRESGAEVIEVRADNIVENREPIQQVPTVALKIGDGWLLGSNRGEWGGELVHRLGDSSAVELMSANVEDIYRLGSRVVATTGLAHLGLNDGVLVELARSADGAWMAARWRRLPGAPTASWLTGDQELYVNTVGGGSVVVNADGELRMAACHLQRPK